MTNRSRELLERLLDAVSHLTTELVAAQDALIEAADAKQQALVSIDMQGLQNVIAREDGLLQIFVTIQTKRIQTLQEIGGILKLDESRMNLENLAILVPEPWASKFVELRAMVVERIELLERLTRLNRVLTEQSMDHINTFFKTIAEAVHPSSTYTHPARKQPDRTGTIMIDHVA
jgi:hypothetical protein